MNVATWRIANYQRARERQSKPSTMAMNSECFLASNCQIVTIIFQFYTAIGVVWKTLTEFRWRSARKTSKCTTREGAYAGTLRRPSSQPTQCPTHPFPAHSNIQQLIDPPLCLLPPTPSSASALPPLTSRSHSPYSVPYLYHHAEKEHSLQSVWRWRGYSRRGERRNKRRSEFCCDVSILSARSC